ncbi:MAG TPA: RNA polymerase sigma factor [Solirubrobacterales bacterium]
MNPPPAEPFASRIFVGPALRTQPDRRLVKLVREGYETAFEEIVRRYRRPLDRFAAAIVGSRSEDVTQDAFSKALLALRGSETDIELRPWLYRIVRNTALNDLRDRGPVTEELAEAIPGGLSAAEEAERREEMADLTERLRSLPEPQRAAIVMRELEGLSHEEIATALGVSGGAARQAIYRARAALREGLAVLVPLPLLRMLFDHGAEAAAGAGGLAAGAAGASAAGGGAGAVLGGLGAGGALKVGAATLLVAGTVGAGVAIQHDRNGNSGPDRAAASSPSSSSSGSEAGSSAAGSGGSSSGPGSDDRGGGNSGPGSAGEEGDDQGSHGKQPGEDHGGGGSGGSGPSSGSGRGPSGDDDSGGHGSRHSGSSGHGGSGSGDDGSGHHSGGLDDNSGSGSSGSGSGHSGGSDDGSGTSGGGESHSGSGDGGSGGSGSGSGGSGSGESIPTVTTPPPPPPPVDDGSGSGSGDSGGGSGDDDPLLDG